MADFAEQLIGNEQLQRRLLSSLIKRKPFSNFKYVIVDSVIYRQQWFLFKEKCQLKYVNRQVEFLKHDEE